VVYICITPFTRSVQILQVLTRDVSMKKTIKLDIECYGITQHNHLLYVTSGWSTEKEVQVMGECYNIIKYSKRCGLGRCYRL